MRDSSHLYTDWMVDAIIDGDTFAPGGFKYLKQVCSWAKAVSDLSKKICMYWLTQTLCSPLKAGIYVLIDLHAGPGCQTSQAFAGIGELSLSFGDLMAIPS